MRHRAADRTGRQRRSLAAEEAPAMSIRRTTARIVANATAEMKPARRLPPTALANGWEPDCFRKQRAAGAGIRWHRTEDCDAAISNDEQHRKEQANETRRVEDPLTRHRLSRR